MIKVPALKHLIFDLDDTMIDTTGLIIPLAVEETAHAMIDAGLKASVDQVVLFRNSLLKENPRHDFIAATVHHFGTITSASVVQEAGHQTFYTSKETRLRRLKGSLHSQQALQFIEKARNKYQIHVVTSGEQITQLNKLEWAELRSTTNEIHCVSAHQPGAKKAAFQDIMNRTGAHADQYMSIGNRLDIDIAEAKALGWQTCWFRHGEYQNMIPSNLLETPDLTVSNWQELHVLL